MNISDPGIEHLFSSVFGYCKVPKEYQEVLRRTLEPTYPNSAYEGVCNCCGSSLNTYDNYRGIAISDTEVPFSKYKMNGELQYTHKHEPSILRLVERRLAEMETSQHEIPDLKGSPIYLTISQGTHT